MDVDAPLLLFRAQYLQCLDPDFLTWPPVALLKQPDAHVFLYKRLFDPAKVPYRPSASYEVKVLEMLIGRIQRAVPGAGATESESLTHMQSRLAGLRETSSSPSQDPLSWQDAYLTYNCSPTLEAWQPVTLHEPRSLIAGTAHTGHRTWEGALHLATYLLAHPSELVTGKRVLELGAGTGFLSIICRKFLDAVAVTATDGEDAVVEGMCGNLRLNGVDDNAQTGVAARRLWWGTELEGNWRDSGEPPALDIVIGADIVYQKEGARALVKALRALLDIQPRITIILSNARRFPAVFQIFEEDCQRNNLCIQAIPHPVIPILKQQSLFFSTAIPLELIEIKHAKIE
ncbi:Protein fam86a [Neopestalotiopsis sp. 37M]|nr:Protein fam86a [Neopestalotiopsis sp. 37M]